MTGLLTLLLKSFSYWNTCCAIKTGWYQGWDIAINVWDVDFETNTNVIDVYISYLRNKVDKHFEQKLIQTHIGMGYILKDH